MLFGIPFAGEFLTKSLYVSRGHLYDVVDRLHFRLTTSVLAFFIMLIGAKQHFGKPIDCMLPAEVDDVKSWNNYIHTFCLIHGTYRYALNASSVYLPKDLIETKVQYYPWVPFFFTVQLFCFALPHWIWRWMQKLLYLDMSLVIAITYDLVNEKESKEHKSKLQKTIGYAYDHFKYRRHYKIGYLYFVFLHPAFACILYIITKLMFLGNVILQLKLVSKFLGFESWTWGFSMIPEVFSPRSIYEYAIAQSSNYSIGWKFHEFNHFKNFPVLVVCDYHTVPTLAGFVNSTAQCIIPLNMINEKIFVGLWIWFVILIAISIIGIVKWIVRLTDRQGYESMVYSLMKMPPKKRFVKSPSSKNLVNDKYFVDKFLGLDGIMLIYFMQEKCGFIQTREVINGLYQRYLEDYEKPKMKPIIMAKNGEKIDYSEINFGASFDEDEVYYRRRL